jgi:3-hydroxybutyryl-CoA dehydrogenase
MKITVIADGRSQAEFNDKGIAEGIQVQFISTLPAEKPIGETVFYLLPEDTLIDALPVIDKWKIPVFVNAIENTCSQLGDNCIRVNAWPGFLLNPVLELAAPPVLQKKAGEILDTLGWKYSWVPDIEGMIASRAIAMIINEAYFALEDNVSSRQDIDTAMKLGTNYPFGPFEWAANIGLEKIFSLLDTLAKKDIRYLPSVLLTQEAKM